MRFRNENKKILPLPKILFWFAQNSRFIRIYQLSTDQNQSDNLYKIL